MSDQIAQAGALAFSEGKLCLITSRRSGRWVIPKGMIDPGYTPEETAINEAWEEAGIEGELQSEPLGTYTYEKWGYECQVTVYRMEVTEIADDWLERDERDRIWVDPREAMELVWEEELREIIRGLVE